MCALGAQDTELFQDKAGPIERFSWGMFVIRGETHGEGAEGRMGAGKDIRLIGKKATPWKERKGHRLKKSMITGVYDEDVDILVIGVGVSGCVEVPDKVRRDVADHGIAELAIERTPEACRTYNRLCRKGKRVALLAHGTC